MEIIDDNTQSLILSGVHDEMVHVQDYISSRDPLWWEQLSRAYSPELYFSTREEILSLERKYNGFYRLIDVFSPDLRVGEPLKKVVLEDEDNNKYNVEFGRVEWHSQDSDKSSMNFAFNNDGTIEFNKEPTSDTQNKLLYNLSYNVLSNGFDIEVTNDFQVSDENHIIDKYSLELNDKELMERFNDLEICRNNSTGKKSIRINKPFNVEESVISIRASIMLKLDGTLQYGLFAINLHNEKAKMIGSYRFEVSGDRGINAKFVRKNESIDLRQKPEYFDELIKILESEPSVSSTVVLDFVNSAKNVIENNIGSKYIAFDSSHFKMKSISDIENRIFGMIKSIKGDIPLLGVNERLDKILEVTQSNEIMEEDSGVQTLRLDK